MKKYKLPRRAIDRPAILYAQWLQDHCKDFKEVYDIGAGDGVIRDSFDPTVKYEGIDLGSDIYSRTGNVSYVENPDELSKAVRAHPSADLVTLMDVLEHSDTFTSLFEDALSIFKRYVFVSLPNELWLYNRIQFLLGRTVPCHSFEMMGKKPGHKHQWLVYIPEAREILNNKAKVSSFELNSEVCQVFSPKRTWWNILYSPLNKLFGIDLMAQGWGGLWIKQKA